MTELILGPNETIVWKIVSVFPENSEYTSINSSSKLNKLSVFYKIGEFVVPNIIGSKLFAFESFEDAQKYGGNSKPYRLIFKSIGKNVKKNPERQAYYYDDPYKVSEFWDRYGKEIDLKELPSTFPNPQGTVFCDSIKLIEEV